MVVTLTAAACASGSTQPQHVHVTAAPASALWDTPITVTVSGLRAGERTTLSATAADDNSSVWRSSATFVATSSGRVDTDEGSVAGSYIGIDPMGLFDRMTPEEGGPKYGDFVPSHRGFEVAVTVSVDGHVVGRTSVRRESPIEVGVRLKTYRPKEEGIYADLFDPAQTRGRRPAVLVFGGSEGGLSVTAEASLLAAHGYPAMALAYFGEPGLPAHLERIPLEYFVKALQVLRDTPGVDPRHIVIWGISRGSEAALLVGSHFPQLVHGVVAAVPSSVVNPGIPDTSQPAWTLAGRALPPVPFEELGNPSPPMRQAIIPVEHINGPVLLVCGEADDLWPSCGYSDAIVHRLAAHGKRTDVTELKYPLAGHAVGGLMPYTSMASPDFSLAGRPLGGTVAADVAGESDGWRHLLQLLAGLG